MSKNNPVCIVCGIGLHDDNWYPSRKAKRHYVCNICHNKSTREWVNNNPHKVCKMSARSRIKQGLNPLYLWLIPAEAINDKLHVSISKSTLHKWKQYEIEIDKTISCCNDMKERTK